MVVGGGKGRQKVGQDPDAPQIDKDQEDRSKKGITLNHASGLWFSLDLQKLLREERVFLIPVLWG